MCVCICLGVHHILLWRGVAQIRPRHLWPLLRKPSEAEVEGCEWGAFLSKGNREGQQNQKKMATGGSARTPPLHALLRKPREPRSQVSFQELCPWERVLKKDQNKKIKVWVIENDACCPEGPPAAPRRGGAKRFPLPPPTQAKTFGRGKRTGQAHRYKFRLTHDNKRPPSLRRVLGSTREAEDPAQAGGCRKVKDKPTFAPMGLLRTHPSSQTSRHAAQTCHSRVGPPNHGVCGKGGPCQVCAQPYK
jgi:hypothetical protein